MSETIQPRTHAAISQRLCGAPVEVRDGFAAVEMEALPEMAADEHGLIHGGFLFGLADHAAMLAIDEPTVVLAGAEVRFLAPVDVGAWLRAEAAVESRDGRKARVTARVVARDGRELMSGHFLCYVPERHVLAAGTGA